MTDDGPVENLMHAQDGSWAAWEWTDYPYHEAYVVDFNLIKGWRVYFVGEGKVWDMPGFWCIVCGGGYDV